MVSYYAKSISMDLIELGRMLEARRKELGLSRAELARRVGKTPNYLWMVERAHLREGSKPPRPTMQALDQWVRALRWNRELHERVMQLAGYLSPQPASQITPATAAFATEPPRTDAAFENKLRQMLAAAGLSYRKRIEAQNEILEHARIVIDSKSKGVEDGFGQ